MSNKDILVNGVRLKDSEFLALNLGAVINALGSIKVGSIKEKHALTSSEYSRVLQSFYAPRITWLYIERLAANAAAAAMGPESGRQPSEQQALRAALMDLLLQNVAVADSPNPASASDPSSPAPA